MPFSLELLTFLPEKDKPATLRGVSLRVCGQNVWLEPGSVLAKSGDEWRFIREGHRYGVRYYSTEALCKVVPADISYFTSHIVQ